MPEKESLGVLDINPEILTPGMKQYHQVKKEHPDCLVMLRMGDFFEMFYQDAVTASRELEITLTARGKGDKRAPLAGIPFHALDTYLARLVKKGYKVAIVEQLEDPKKAKGLVKRGLVRIVTPGTIIESSILNEKENNYLIALTSFGEEFTLASCDMSTGEFLVTKIENQNFLFSEIARLNPSECLIPESLGVDKELLQRVKSFGGYVNTLPDYFFRPEQAKKLLLEHFKLRNLESFGLEEDNRLIGVSGALLQYLLNTQKNSLSHLKKISYVSNLNKMFLDAATLRNLELIKNIRDGTARGTLLSIIDKTITAMGSRLLKRWIKEPLLNPKLINQRLDAVEEFHKNLIIREEMTELLAKVYDIERLISRVNYGNANPKDLLSLKISLQQIPLIKEKLAGFNSEILKQMAVAPSVDEIAVLIDTAVLEEAPVTIREGGIFKTRYNPELDQLQDIKKNSRKYLQELEEQEKQKTNVPTLRLGYTKVFGYFFEVTHKNMHLVPNYFTRKQTTVNSERFITPELKEIEEKILGAEEKIYELEYNLFQELLQKVSERTSEIQQLALSIAVLDVLSSLAKVAAENNYTRSEIVEERVIQIKSSRHPVIEKQGQFIANDLFLDPGQMIILTGPNMSGKCLTEESLIFSNVGMIPIKYFKPIAISAGQFIPRRIIINGINGDEETSHFYYDGKRPTIRIITQFGYEIEGTFNHPILVRTKEGKEIWKKLGYINPDDYVIIKRKINLWGKTTRISLEKIKQIYSYTYNNRVINYKIPLKMDRDLAYIIGLLIGDGTLTYKNVILLSNVDKPIIHDFYTIMTRKFGCPVRTKKNGMDHYVSSRRIRLFFEVLGLNYVDCFKKEVPLCILQAPKNIVREFLRGLFDTDGEADNRYGNVSLSTSSLKLAKQVQIILLNLGIISSLREKKTNRNKNYRVSVSGEDSISFHQKIGFRLERKRIRKDLASNLRVPNYGIPYMESLLKEIQKRIVTKKNKKIALKKVKNINSIFYTYLPNKRNISYKKLKELIDYCKLNNVFCQELENIFNNYYCYNTIKSIKKSTLPKDVYDFSIPNTHSFVANGLINHNSTLMRQAALIVLLAQMGSFVPAEKAVLGIVDRIFTRVGAYDDLSSGQSTFMVEMAETASILNNATENSLIVLDEIGRGTSTFDGVSIAWSVAEHIYNRLKSKTLFSTHYHVLNKLEEKFSRIKNYNIAVREVKGEVIFLHKLIPGATDQSYGVHVAKLAGLPNEVVDRAREIQQLLQEDDEMVRRIKAKKIEEQMSLKGFWK